MKARISVWGKTLAVEIHKPDKVQCPHLALFSYRNGLGKSYIIVTALPSSFGAHIMV